jgi:hypothetical protein
MATSSTIECAGAKGVNTYTKYNLAIKGTDFPAFVELTFNGGATFKQAYLASTTALTYAKSVEIVA